MITPVEKAEEYASENAHAMAPIEVKLRRAYMAGALEAAMRKPHDVIRECLDFAKTIFMRLIAPKPNVEAIDGTQAAFDADHPDAGSLFAAEHGSAADQQPRGRSRAVAASVE